MPLQTNIVRDGEPLLLRWGWWHVTVMAMQCALDERRITVWEAERMVLAPGWLWKIGLFATGKHIVDVGRVHVDPADGEVLVLHAGDVLLVQR